MSCRLHGYPWPFLATSPYHSWPLAGLHPISSHSCCMYVRAGRPTFAWPYAGVHRSTSLISSSLLLQQCPACLVRLTWILGHTLLGRHCRRSRISDMWLCHIHHILLISQSLTTFFFQVSGHSFTSKTFCSKIEVETAFQDFLVSKLWEFYRIGINNLVNRWLKCIDVQWSYFNLLKQSFGSLIQE